MYTNAMTASACISDVAVEKAAVNAMQQLGYSSMKDGLCVNFLSSHCARVHPRMLLSNHSVLNYNRYIPARRLVRTSVP